MKLDFHKIETNQTINFAKDFGTPISGKVSFNLNWGMINHRAVDLDSILVMECRNGQADNKRVARPLTLWQKVAKFFGLKVNETFDIISSHDVSSKTVYFGNLHEQGVTHHGDDRTGAWAKGEFIEIDLDKLNPNVDTLTFAVLSFSNHDFSALPFAEIKVSTGSPSHPLKGLVEHNLTNFKRGTRNVVIAQLKRNDNGEWIMTAMNHETTSSGVHSSVNLAKSI